MNSTKPYWKLLLRVIRSPRFHWFFLKARLKSNFVTSPQYRRLMSLGFALAVILAVTMTNHWVIFIVAWVFPLTVLYHISALFQLLSEHCWGAEGSIESKSHGRFCGEAPPFGGSSRDWLRWLFRMTFYHLPVRVSVLSDPEICPHDFHHNYPKADKNWPNAVYNRQEQVDAGTNYREFWGIHKAIEHVFKNLAQTPELPEEDTNDPHKN